MDWITKDHTRKKDDGSIEVVECRLPLIDCLYPDGEGGLIKDKHHFDNIGFCQVCGMTIEQATRGEIKMGAQQSREF